MSLIKNAKGLDKLGAAIELPSSIQKTLQGDGDARLFLSYYSTGAMFPLEQDRIQKDGQRLEVSSVVAASLEGATVRNLTEDVFITFQLGHSNYSNVTCVSWDFSSSGVCHSPCLPAGHHLKLVLNVIIVVPVQVAKVHGLKMAVS